MKALYPSLISSDLLQLGTTITSLNPYSQGYHIDLMDDHFVPNLTWGHQFVNAIDAACPAPSWVHCMIEFPEKMIPRLHVKPQSIISIHIESTSKIKELISAVKEKKWRASIAISPKTDLQLLFPYLGTVDQVLLMSVEPGFSGQKFLHVSIERLKALALMRDTHKYQFRIGIDGGVTEDNVQQLMRLGADDFAIASALFNSSDPVAALKSLQQL